MASRLLILRSMNTIRGLYRASLKVVSFPTQVGEQTICQYNYIWVVIPFW